MKMDLLLDYLTEYWYFRFIPQYLFLMCRLPSIAVVAEGLSSTQNNL